MPIDAKTDRILKARLQKVAATLRNIKIAADAVRLKGTVSVTGPDDKETEFPYDITVPALPSYQEYLGRINSELEAAAKAAGVEVDGNIDLSYEVIPADDSDPLEMYLKACLAKEIQHNEWIGNRMVDTMIAQLGRTQWYALKDADVNGQGNGGLSLRFDYYPDEASLLDAYFSVVESLDEGTTDAEAVDEIIALLENGNDVYEVLRDEATMGDTLVVMQP